MHINAELLFKNALKLTWTNDLRNNKTQYEKVLHSAKTELSHLDHVADSKKRQNPDLFTESLDSEIETTKVVLRVSQTIITPLKLISNKRMFQKFK